MRDRINFGNFMQSFEHDVNQVIMKKVKAREDINFNDPEAQVLNPMQKKKYIKTVNQVLQKASKFSGFTTFEELKEEIKYA